MPRVCARGLISLAHLIAYAARVAGCQVSTAFVDADGVVTRHSRRDLLPFFAKALAAVALATVLPSAARAERLSEQCCGPVWAAVLLCDARALSLYRVFRKVSNWLALRDFFTNENSAEGVCRSFEELRNFHNMLRKEK